MTQLKAFAAILLVSAVQGGRVSISKVLEHKVEEQAKSIETGKLGRIDLGTDKLCCCEKFAADQRCYWQQRIPLDTGSGCNWVGFFNPFADRKHISGIMGDGGKMITFDTQKYGSQYSGDDDQEAEYAAQCVSAIGRIVLSDGADGEKHQYVKATSPIYLFPANSGPGEGVNKEYFPEDADPVVFQAPSEAAAFATPELAVEVVDQAKEAITQASAQAEELVTSKHLKACMRAKNDVMCDVACDPWTPVGTQTQKKGCHTPLSSSTFKSNAQNYCKNACSMENGCKSTTPMPGTKAELRAICR